MAQELRATRNLSDSGVAPVARTMTRLIVLPFRMLRPDPEIDFLSFSLADAITDSLGSLTSLVVRSSVAAARFKAEAPDLAALATELDVNAAVTGTLLRAGSEVRVATQLVEAPGGRLLWSRTTQVTLADIFQLQDDLTRQIVESLSLPLSAREERLLSRDAPANARSYEYFLRANELASDPKSWAIARDLYEQAVQEDPRYAPAWAGLGRVRRLIGKLGGGTIDELAGVEAALKRALELNPDLPLAHNLTAQLDIDQGRAREAMGRLLNQASRRRTDPELFVGLVYACRYCGLLDASRRADEAARRLDPSIKTSVIHTLWMLREYEAVLASKVEAPLVVGFAFVALGRENEALDFLASREPKLPPKLRQMIGVLRALLEGRWADAVTAIQAIASSGFRDPEALYYLARQAARLGAAEDAVALLKSATAAGFCCYPLLVSDESLDPVRRRPEFADLLAHVKREHELAAAAFATAARADSGRALTHYASAGSHTTRRGNPPRRSAPAQWWPPSARPGLAPSECRAAAAGHRPWGCMRFEERRWRAGNASANLPCRRAVMASRPLLSAGDGSDWRWENETERLAPGKTNRALLCARGGLTLTAAAAGFWRARGNEE